MQMVRNLPLKEIAVGIKVIGQQVSCLIGAWPSLALKWFPKYF